MRIPLYLQTLIGMFLGIAVGLNFGKSVEGLGIVSKYLIEIIKTAAMPLLFFAILDALLNSELKGKSFFAMCFVYTFNAVMAVSIALFISNYFEPGKYLSLKLDPSSIEKFVQHHNVALGEFLNEMENPAQYVKGAKSASLFSGTTAAIALAMGLGLLLLFLQKAKVPLSEKLIGKTRKVNGFALKLLFRFIEGLSYLIPIAVFCAVSKVVGTTGFSFVKGLMAYFISCASGMFFHVLIVYQFWIFLSGKSVKHFWREAREAVTHSFGINSSLATLPLTLNALKRLKVSDGSARMAACVGTNFNNDGILLYEVVAALYMIQAYGLSLPIAEQLWLCLICVIATIGVAGIPEAGMISLALVLAAIGLPTQDLPVLLTVDWVLGRMRSVTNVVGDLSGAISLDFLSEKTK